MANSSILGADRAPTQADGRDVDRLGPSDTTDSGSDIQGAFQLDDDGQFDTQGGARQPGLGSDSDSGATGERGAARIDEQAADGADIAPDQVQRFDALGSRELDAADATTLDLAADEQDVEADVDDDEAAGREAAAGSAEPRGADRDAG